MPKRHIGMTVFDAAIDRMVKIYEVPTNQVIVSFSAGKDSGVALEICVLAAAMTGRLPVKAVMRDEEIMFPGTFEYAERIYNRPEIDLHWVIANQPIINIFNRELPYWWVFDPALPPEAWVRQPPDFAYHTRSMNIERMVEKERFGVSEADELYQVTGIRASESRARLMGVFSSKSYITKKNMWGSRLARPLYDWRDGDIWKSIHDNHWDYNEAYDVMRRMGVNRDKLRIAPPTMNIHGVDQLQFASKAWPKWFDAVCKRLDGVRLAAKFGKAAVLPVRRYGESWEQCFYRTCINEAPAWIADRARWYSERKMRWHARHSSQPFPEIVPCTACEGKTRSWRMMAMALYNGDPFGTHIDKLPAVEPDFFREGAGKWYGKPTW